LFDFLGIKERLRSGQLANEIFEVIKPVRDEARNPATSSARMGPNMPAPFFFADSIVLWSEGVDDWRDFVLQSRKLIAAAFVHGLPLRGAIAFGDCFIDLQEDAFLGLPLVHAFKVERSQKWLGVALHRSFIDAEAVIPDLMENLEANGSVVRYDPPIGEKCQAIRDELSGFVLNYFCGGRQRSIEVVRSMKANAKPEYAMYYDNTIRFLDSHGCESPVCLGDLNFVPADEDGT
jgi:hypothetical protein